MKLEIIPTKEILYDKCENVEQLYDNYYYPLLVEFKELQNNWNELKKWLEENKHFYNITGEDLEEDTTITEVLNKMQELEQGKDVR